VWTWDDAAETGLLVQAATLSVLYVVSCLGGPPRSAAELVVHGTVGQTAPWRGGLAHLYEVAILDGPVARHVATEM
jgi:hypothetical protein